MSIGLPQPPDSEHDQPADPEPGGGWPVVPAGLRARHRQWLHPDVLALRPHMVQVIGGLVGVIWFGRMIILDLEDHMVLLYVVSEYQASYISQDSSIHHLCHGIRLDLYPGSDGGRQVWRSDWKENFEEPLSAMIFVLENCHTTIIAGGV